MSRFRALDIEGVRAVVRNEMDKTVATVVRKELDAREQWKRAQRRDAVERAGVCISTGRDDCICPNCVEARDFRAGKIDNPYATPPIKLRFTKDELWRMTSHDAEIQGKVMAHGSIMRADEYVPNNTEERLKYHMDMMESVTPAWAKRLLEKKMTPMLIEMMLHFYYSAGPFPRRTAPAYIEGTAFLKRAGLIEPTTLAEQKRNPGWYYRATEKGRVYVEALKALPLPVQTEPEWIMPKEKQS